MVLINCGSEDHGQATERAYNISNKMKADWPTTKMEITKKIVPFKLG